MFLLNLFKGFFKDIQYVLIFYLGEHKTEALIGCEELWVDKGDDFFKLFEEFIGAEELRRYHIADVN